MSDTVRLRSKRQPENVQEFDAKTAQVLIERGRWEKVPDAEPQHAPKPGSTTRKSTTK